MRKREKTPKGAYSGDAEHRLPTRSCNSREPEASPLCVGLLPRLSGSSAPFQFRFQLPDAGFGRVGTGFGGASCLGNSGTGKTHVALGLGLAACQRGMSVGFTTLPPWSTS